MRVLHVFAELKYSGAEIMYVAAAKSFQARGCELYAVNTLYKLGDYAPVFEKAGFKVYHWPYVNPNFFEKQKYYRNVIAFVKENKIDVIHVHRPDLKLGMAFCAWSCSIKSIWTIHNVFPTRWFSYPYHLWLRWCSKIVFHQIHQSISDSVYEREKYFFHNNTVLIYNWYNKEKIYPDIHNEKYELRKKLGLSSNSLVIISIGGCSGIKRHCDILYAIKELKSSYTNVSYLHLGEGNATKSEMELASALEISDNVRFLGNQDDVRNFLISSDIYVMTSKFEGISLTTIEAMACGIPCILYDVPGLRDFNINQECAMLIKEDPKELADSIVKLSENTAKRNSLTNSAIQFVKSNYDTELNSMKIYGLYT